MAAKDVTIETLQRAGCNRDGCDWKGELRRNWADANRDREEHLTDPRCKGLGAQPSLLGDDPELAEARRALDLIEVAVRSTLPPGTALDTIREALRRTGRARDRRPA